MIKQPEMEGEHRTYDKGSISEEPDAPKGARPVLETSQTGDCLA